MTLDYLKKQHGEATDRYRSWLTSQPHGLARAKKWSNDLASCEDEAKAEGAIAEALVWGFLRSKVTKIDSADDPSKGGPDFRCWTDPHSFFVEVTNISRETMTNVTHIIDCETTPFVGGHFRLATKQITAEVRAKAKQFSRRKFGCPLLVFVTTLHGQASRDVIAREHVPNILFDDGGFSGLVDLSGAENPRVVELGETYGRSSSICYIKMTGELTRLHISGVIVGGFGDSPPPVFGVLHPFAAYPFDPSLLPGVPSATVVPWPLQFGDSFEIRWSDEWKEDNDPGNDGGILAPIIETG